MLRGVLFEFRNLESCELEELEVLACDFFCLAGRGPQSDHSSASSFNLGDAEGGGASV